MSSQIFCPACATPNEPNSRFCEACGRALSPSAVQSAAPHPALAAASAAPAPAASEVAVGAADADRQRRRELRNLTLYFLLIAALVASLLAYAYWPR